VTVHRAVTIRRGSTGQALVEAVLVGLLLLVPLLWALTVLADLHRNALAASAAAREAGFEAVRAGGVAAAGRAIHEAVFQTFADHELDPNAARVTWATTGLRRGSPVVVEVAVRVPVANLPLLGDVVPASVWIRARHVARVDPYGSLP
jgi:hypothetical protein